MKSIDLTKWKTDIFAKLRFKAYLNGNGDIEDYLRSLIMKDPIQRRSPLRRYCFGCHEDQITVPVNLEDTFIVNVDGIKHEVTVDNYPMERCSQCGTAYSSLSLGVAYEEVLEEIASQKKADGKPIPERVSFHEWLFDDQPRSDITRDIIILNKSQLAEHILTLGKSMDVVTNKNDRIEILAKMELLQQLIHSEGAI